MIEEWRDIKGYEGLYQVSNTGKVRSLNYHLTGKTKILRPAKSKKGYLQLHLSKNGQVTNFKVHRIVADTFLSNPLNLTEINHKDENKTNNNVDNLEWCSREYNVNYGTRNQTVSERLTNRTDLSKPVLQFTKTGVLVNEYQSTQEASRNGFTGSLVVRCCNGERHTHRGFMWKYK